jgi:hypothetical protein
MVEPKGFKCLGYGGGGQRLTNDCSEPRNKSLRCFRLPGGQGCPSLPQGQQRPKHFSVPSNRPPITFTSISYAPESCAHVSLSERCVNMHWLDGQKLKPQYFERQSVLLFCIPIQTIFPAATSCLVRASQPPPALWTGRLFVFCPPLNTCSLARLTIVPSNIPLPF